MHDNTTGVAGKVVMITGAARRVGAVLAGFLHGHGMNIVLHYRHSRREAEALAAQLNAARAHSVILLQADLLYGAGLARLVQEALGGWGRLDALINNASSFYPTPFGAVTDAEWDDLLGSNLKAPFFLSQAASGALAAQRGCIINIADIHGLRPLKNYPVYSTAQAGLIMLTQALARELAPAVRVNAIAPGPVLWPEGMEEAERRNIVARTLLQRAGDPLDIARAALYLIRDADYVTGQTLTVDGGRSVKS